MLSKVFLVCLNNKANVKISTRPFIRIADSVEATGTGLKMKYFFMVVLGAYTSFVSFMYRSHNPRERIESETYSKYGCIALVGPSGVGKGTLIRNYLKRNSNAALVCSHTTRPPRSDEIDGVNYHFVTVEQFQQLKDANQFLETNEYSGNLYGTSITALEAIKKSGKLPILDVDVHGNEALIKANQHPNSIFVVPPDPPEATLRERLVNRGERDEEKIKQRLATGLKELDYLKHHKELFHVIVNDDLRQAQQRFDHQVHKVVEANRKKE